MTQIVHDFEEPVGPLEFSVVGQPATQGSKVAFKHATSGKVIVMDDCKRNPAWRAEVAYAARMAMQGRPIFEGAVELHLAFTLPRPKKHFTRKGIRLGSAPLYPIVKPDLTKMERAVEDALKGFVWNDDSQVCRKVTWKLYAGPEQAIGVKVTVTAL